MPQTRFFAGTVRAWKSIGGWSSRGVIAALFTVFALWVLLDIFVLRLTTGLANSSYDAMVRARIHAAQPDPRVVIVDIDESSLASMAKEFGRWPWPRDTLATVLTFIEQQQPAAIVWDIAFSDADRFSPGGDKAFDEAAAKSGHSHFSIVRLPTHNDAYSELGPRELPSLWLNRTETVSGNTVTVALIAPVLPAIAASRLGFNNGYPDRDGVLRRYRYLENLGDDWALKSIAYSVASAVNPAARTEMLRLQEQHPDSLIAWRAKANSYPRIPFARVFEKAEGGHPAQPLPSFKDKVVIIGSTAPSLHDIHPSPLSATQAGVDSLATVIDNAINQRFVREFPRWLQASIAIGVCAGIALWVMFRGVASLDPVLFALPISLLAISYASLNGLPFFIDLYLPAALGLAFLAALRFWNNQRRDFWCTWEAPHQMGQESMGLVSCRGNGPWADGTLDRLIDAVADHLPRCRVVVTDASVQWPSFLRWPELAVCAAIVGSKAEIEAGLDALRTRMSRRVQEFGAVVDLPDQPCRAVIAKRALVEWNLMEQGIR